MFNIRLPADAKSTQVLAKLRHIPPAISIVTILIVLYVGLNALIYFFGPELFGSGSPFEQASSFIAIIKERGTDLFLPKPKIGPGGRIIYPLPQGRQEYSVQYGPAATGPKIQKAVVDPLDPGKGGSQTVTLTVKNDSPVTSAEATLITDLRQTPGTFRLISGTPTNGTWQLTWKIQDSYDLKYQIYLTLNSTTGGSDDALTFR